MRRDDLELFDEDQIRAQLEEAINQPLANLLSIEEFVEKLATDAHDNDAEPPAEIRFAA